MSSSEHPDLIDRDGERWSWGIWLDTAGYLSGEIFHPLDRTDVVRYFGPVVEVTP